MAGIDLIQRFLDGDRNAFNELVDRYSDMVFRVCYGFVKNPEEAEDITQDVFLTVYKNLGTFKRGSKLSTWIYRIAVNRSLNHIRKTKRAKLFSLFTKDSEDAERKEAVLTDTTPADRKIISKERLAIIQKALNSLPDNQRTAFTLHNIEGFSYEDIAGIMECSVSAVESRIHRAKMSLQKKLAEYIKDLL